MLTRPKVIVSCQGLPRGSPNQADPYAASGAQFLGTWPHGAITIRSHPDGLTVETFQTRQSFLVASGSLHATAPKRLATSDRPR